MEKIMTNVEQETDLYTEHSFHDTYTESCSECYKESRLIRAKRIVDLGTSPAQGRMEDANRSQNTNPCG